MKFARVSIAVLSLSFAIAAAGCFGSSSSNPVTSGPIDGSYVLSGISCAGTAQTFPPSGVASMELIISNLTGSFIEVLSSDACTITQGQTNTYPSSGSISMTTVTTACGSNCTSGQCTAGNVSNPTAQSFTYTLSGSTLTMTGTSNGNDGCTSGQAIVYTATKQ
jgi:hypothetical protein